MQTRQAATPCTARPPLLGLLVALLVVGCGPQPVTSPKATPAPARAPGPLAAHAPGNGPLAAAPQPAARFVDTAGGARLAGRVVLRALDHPFFENNLAAYRVQALPLASRNALVTLSNLEEALFTTNGAVIATRSGPNGDFDLALKAPLEGPFVVGATLAGGHRLTALALPGETTVTLDEASSLIAETARWQLRSSPATLGQRSLRDVNAATLATLREATVASFDGAPFTPSSDAVPRVEALQTGAGHVLRNHYLLGFGTAVTPAGTDDAAPANVLSDTWAQILGFRPLALSRVAGNGVFSFGAGDGEAAPDTPLLGPVDAVADAAGNLFITEESSNLIRYVPAADEAGPHLGRADDMLAGCAYTLAGQPEGPQDLDTYNALYDDASTASPDGAPAVADGVALFRPQKLVLEPAGGGRSHLYFTTGQGQRLMMIPAEDVTRCNRALKAGLLYTLAGTGVARLDGDPPGDDGPADAADLAGPRGLARDAQGNFFLLEAESGQIRVLRDSDGRIFSLPLTQTSTAFTVPGAADLRLSPDGQRLVVADTARHFVFSVPAPTAPEVAAFSAALPPAAREITRVLGHPGVGGFLDVDVPGVSVPAPTDMGQGIPESGTGGIQVLLEAPVSLDFDAGGTMVVADRYRVRALGTDGVVHTLAGGYDTRYLTGDARLAFLPQTSYLNFHAASGTFWLTDLRENVVRRLWTSRGLF